MTANKIDRRALISTLFRTAASTVLAVPAAARLAAQARFPNQNQPRAGMGAELQAFQQRYRVPATSAAISARGRFVFDHAGGMADREHSIQAQQNSLFRIADLSKPITSVSIFSLIEQGKVHLTDKVFGDSGILGAKYGKPPYKTYVSDITVDHLLTHTAGGWAADANDPMLHNNGWDAAKLIASTIQNVALTNQPGTQWAYSNFGYCILGRVIEQVSGQAYEDFVKSAILGPCGITDMQIAKNSQRQRALNEVIYIGQYSEDPYKINVERMDSTAGWIASSTQLIQFLNHVAGAPGIPALLQPETIRTMTTPVNIYPSYARGWMLSGNGTGNWWHSGSLPGSTALMIRTPDGACSAVICNTRSEPHQEMDASLLQLSLNMLERFSR